jgi:hypothetical protein
VRTIIDDETIYEHLKLMGLFARLAGYQGLLVAVDEMVNLYKLASGRARNANYERLLAVLNDSLQGQCEGLGFLFAGTPEFLSDPRRGLYSYAALQSRLGENAFATGELVDFTGPVLRLASLAPEELFVLLRNLRHVHAGGDPERYLLPDEGLEAFMQHCNEVVGASYFRTPRSVVRSFVNLLAVLEQNPTADWRQLVGETTVEEEANPDLMPLDDDEQDAGDDDLASFTL